MNAIHTLKVSKGSKPRRGVVKPCDFCKADVYYAPYRAKQKNFFCNQEHMILWMKENAFTFSCYVCGKEKHTQPYQMKIRPRPTCGKKCAAWLKRKDAEKRRKTYTKHQLDRLARYSPEAKKWREAVFKRDDYTCRWCGIRGTYLEADHIKPWAYFPELRFVLSNGRTLCRKCHNTTKIGAKAMREKYTLVENT